MPHTAEVALTLLADIAREDHIAAVLDLRLLERRRHREHADHPSAVIARPGSLEPRPIQLRLDRRISRKHSIDVGREKYPPRARIRPSRALSHRDSVADPVEI